MHTTALNEPIADWLAKARQIGNCIGFRRPELIKIIFNNVITKVIYIFTRGVYRCRIGLLEGHYKMITDFEVAAYLFR